MPRSRSQPEFSSLRTRSFRDSFGERNITSSKISASKAKDWGLIWDVVPLAVPLPPAADPAAGRAFRERRGIPADAPLLGCFGFQTPIKRTRVAIRALAAPALARAHLVVVGEVSQALDLAGEARSLGVAERLHVTGFVGFDEMEAGIAASDLCLNLRYPSAGETSASLLRILAVGRPAVVSEYAQFAELPADVVVRVPVAVVGDVSAISGMWPWCTVVTSSTAPRTKAAMVSLPRVRPSPSVVPSRISAGFQPHMRK